MTVLVLPLQFLVKTTVPWTKICVQRSTEDLAAGFLCTILKRFLEHFVLSEKSHSVFFFTFSCFGVFFNHKQFFVFVFCLWIFFSCSIPKMFVLWVIASAFCGFVMIKLWVLLTAEGSSTSAFCSFYYNEAGKLINFFGLKGVFKYMKTS